MVPFWKSSKVHAKKSREKKDLNTEKWTSLTVSRKSLLLNFKGFTVFDCNGNLVYRVDDYIGQRPDEIVLMDGSGETVLTICRSKKLRLMENWLVYEGETCKRLLKEPICCMKKNINILQRPRVNMLAHVYHGLSEKKCAYKIEGSYANRSCRVLDDSMIVLAEIKRKEEIKDRVTFGLDVFVLLVRPEFNCNFAMGIVLLLDQMFS